MKKITLNMRQSSILYEVVKCFAGTHIISMRGMGDTELTEIFRRFMNAMRAGYIDKGYMTFEIPVYESLMMSGFFNYLIHETELTKEIEEAFYEYTVQLIRQMKAEDIQTVRDELYLRIILEESGLKLAQELN